MHDDLGDLVVELKKVVMITEINVHQADALTTWRLYVVCLE